MKADSPPLKSVLQDRLIECSLYLGIVVLAAGVLISVAGDFFPPVLDWLGRIDCPINSRLFPMLTPLAGLAQTLWLVGSVILLVAPIYRHTWIFIVLQTYSAFSCLMPVLKLSTLCEAIGQLALAYLGIIALILLRQVPSSCLWKIVMPQYWLETLLGKHGPMQTCVVGTGFAGCGYALMAVSPIPAYCLIWLGSVFLARFAYLGMKQCVPLAKYWYVLNWIFIVGLGAKILLAVARLSS